MYNNYDNNKDKRISFLSIYSSLATLYHGSTAGYEIMSNEAFQINEKLYQKYPIIEETNNTPSFAQKLNGGANNSVRIDSNAPICERCNIPMTFVKAGVSKKTNKAYTAFWSCPNNKSRGCKTVPVKALIEEDAYGPIPEEYR